MLKHDKKSFILNIDDLLYNLVIKFAPKLVNVSSNLISVRFSVYPNNFN